MDQENYQGIFLFDLKPFSSFSNKIGIYLRLNYLYNIFHFIVCYNIFHFIVLGLTYPITDETLLLSLL